MNTVKKSFFASVGGQLLLRHERTLFSQTTSHAGMEKYSWHTNRWFSLGTWRTSIPISFVCTVAVPRQLRLPCAAVHWRSCKQNNWHFLVQTVFCLFLLLLRHHPAKFQSLQTFILGFIRIIIITQIGQTLSKIKSLCVKSSACRVSPLHHRNQPSGWVLKFILLPKIVPLILAIPSFWEWKDSPLQWNYSI